MSNRTVTKTDTLTIDALLSGAKWGAGDVGTATELTYSFPSGDSYWAYTTETDKGWYGLSSSARPAFVKALNLWADVSGLTFTEVPDGVTYGDIRIAYSQAVADNSSGHAYLPGGGTISADDPTLITPAAQNGDIWLHPSTTDFAEGGHGFHTLVHEIGHALGLKHSFEVEGDFPALTGAEDSTRYTVMSYTDSDAAGYSYTNLSGNRYSSTLIQPSTPMLYDIQAIQHLYGANADYKSGDTTWTFETRGNFMTIWDGGGIDTIDLSNQVTGANLNLNAGTFSDIGQRQMSYQGVLEAAQDNVAIAFGAEIENAIGSAHNDTLTGNALDNSLTGGGGNDTLIGGDGDDTAVFAGNRADYAFQSTDDGLTVQGADGLDTLTGIESLQFDDQTVLVADLNLATTDPISPLPTKKSEVVHTPAESDKAYFLLELSEALTTVASVKYETRDGTAKAGEDYVATNGTVTLQPGQTFVAIGVELIDDNVSEANEYFQLAVTDPVGGVFGNDAVELVAQRIIIDNDTAA